eukprot:gene9554-6710_t
MSSSSIIIFLMEFWKGSRIFVLRPVRLVRAGLQVNVDRNKQTNSSSYYVRFNTPPITSSASTHRDQSQKQYPTNNSRGEEEGAVGTCSPPTHPPTYNLLLILVLCSRFIHSYEVLFFVCLFVCLFPLFSFFYETHCLTDVSIFNGVNIIMKYQPGESVRCTLRSIERVECSKGTKTRETS